MSTGRPTLANGKICYVEIPASDAEQSAMFYERVFGWRLQRRGDGTISFDDAANEVSGAWVSGLQPLAEPGLLVHIMVADAAAAVSAVVSAGGEIVRPIDPEADEVVAWFRDPWRQRARDLSGTEPGRRPVLARRYRSSGGRVSYG
jgi:predicted enzyme related to lactoylglutathione lyase